MTVIGDTEVTDLTVMDFEYDEPCDFVTNGKPCTNSAVWIIIVSCCGASFVFCQAHFDKLLEDIRVLDGLACNVCDTISAPPSTIITSATKIRG